MYLAAERPATKDPEHASATTPRPYATVLSETPPLDDDDFDDDFDVVETFSSRDTNVALSSSRPLFSAAPTDWYDVVVETTVFIFVVFVDSTKTMMIHTREFSLI